MGVRYALLGLLEEKPDYGYRLRKRFEQRVGEVWRVNLGQVYQTLHAMNNEGLICQVSTDADGALEDEALERQSFELTAKGRTRLEMWLRRPLVSPRPLRDEMLVRLLILEPGRRDEALKRIAAQEKIYARHLTKLVRRKRKVAKATHGPELVALLSIEAAEAHAEAHLDWLDTCRKRLTADLEQLSSEDGKRGQ